MSESYQSRIGKFSAEADVLSRRQTLYSFIRLLFFSAAIFLFIFLYARNLIVAIASTVLALAGLLLFVSLSKRLSQRKRILNALIRINTDEIRCMQGEFHIFDPGDAFMDADHPYTSDLDVFGAHSLFQFLNRTFHTRGRKQLAGWLSGGFTPELIPEIQEALGELRDKLPWRQLFQAHGQLTVESEEEIRSLLDWITLPPSLLGKTAYRILLWAIPALTIASIMLAIQWIPVNVPVTLILLQLGWAGFRLRRTNRSHGQVSRKYNLLLKYSVLMDLLEKEDFNAHRLIELKKKLYASGEPAGKVVHKLAQLVDRFDWRINMITGVLLNGLLMWDMQCILRLEKWKKMHGVELPLWFEALGEFDALNSLANFCYNHPEYIFPVPDEKGPIIDASNLGHPLLPGSERIGNDIRLGDFGEYLLITGSNMAGKSTFLRTVGINLVLAAAGAPVCADSMVFRPVGLVSSMRIRDSLSSRESTFYAELKRLRMIIDMHREGRKVLVLLDEILKGTNSRDKHYGSEMFIRQMIEYKSVGLVATHDLELSRLEDEYPDKLKNYSFEVQIENQEFIYDYKLRRGVCETMNATELMKKMGIRF